MSQILKNIKNMKNNEKDNISYIKAKMIDIYISKVGYNIYKKRQTKLRPDLKQEIMKMMQDQAKMEEDIKVNVFEGIKANLFSFNQAKAVAISILVVSSLTYLVYYNFSSKISQPKQKDNIIANQEIPKIKVTPTPINAPADAPSSVEIVDVDMMKNKNNNNNDNDKRNKKNKQSIAKSNSNLEEKLATNSTNNKNNMSIKQASKQASSDTISEDRSANLVGLRKIYISNLIETELREILEKHMEYSKKFTVVDQLTADAILQWSFSQPDTIILSTTSNPILWKTVVDKSMSLQEQAESIIFSLVHTIDIEEEKLKKNKQ